MQIMPIQFNILAWSAWTSSDNTSTKASPSISVTEKPAVETIPPMLRRRLNVLGRACAAQILAHSSSEENIPIVYSSRHGDVERTLSVLQEIAAGEPVSPMAFSLAVHNAISGIVSIQQKNRANILTVAAPDPLVPVLLEAAGLLAEGADKVLCVLADTELPELYRKEGDFTQVPWAASFVISQSGDGLDLELKPGGEGADACDYPELDFIRWMDGEKHTIQLNHSGEAWSVSRRSLH